MDVHCYFYYFVILFLSPNSLNILRCVSA